ncbi:MAG TPA: bacteriohopanetetrol glucosamine biosynthesis glycosyltransferase HpnI [Candidatus Binatia bacterium]
MHTHIGLAYAFQLLIIIGLLVSVAFYLIGYFEARRFFRQSVRATGHNGRGQKRPGVTILKPLKGLDVYLYENLSSFCTQDYPTLQIVFGVADGDDPAVQVVRRLQAAHPSLNIDLVIDRRVYGTNYKVSNLYNMYRVAKHEVILIADSDIRVKRDYVRRIVAGLADPQVGLVTCLYRAVNTGGLPTLVETLFINTDFVPMVLMARVVEKPSYAFGATMAMRRSTLDEIGGFLPLASHLADDYHLGNRIAARGYRLALSDVVVETVLGVGKWKRLFDHQLRWARTYRNCRPGGYFGSIMTHGTLWATLNLMYHHFSPGACTVAALVYGLRIATASAICNRHLGAPLNFGHALLVPVKDLFVSLVWLLCFLGDTVHWSGFKFRVMKDGRMIQLSPPATVEPSLIGYPSVQEEQDRHPAPPLTARDLGTSPR